MNFSISFYSHQRSNAAALARNVEFCVASGQLHDITESLHYLSCKFVSYVSAV